MPYTLKRLQKGDDSWKNLELAWSKQCEAVGDQFDDYAVDSIPVLRDCVEKESDGNHLRESWAVCICDEDDQSPLLAALVHWHSVPGLPYHVLKIRQVTVCPALDAGDIGNDETYADVLIALTWNVYQLSNKELSAGQIRFHLRSPADVKFFAAFGKNLDGTNVFAEVKHRGAWLHITK